jgi:salicylate hydroxylase
MPQPPPSKPFTIAIIGGGISGLTLAIALLSHPVPIPLTIYESAASFGEIGAGVGFEPCFVRTMGKIAPGIREGFLRCTGKSVDGNRHGDGGARPKSDGVPNWQNIRISDCRKADVNGVVCRRDGEDVKSDETLFTIPARRGERGGVHRAHFLSELVKLVPPFACQFRKRLVDISEAGDRSGDAVLRFADGTTARHAAVVGCDGIKSATRSVVLGREEGRAVFSGKVAYRGLVPMERAVEVVGEERTRASQMYCGKGGHVLTFPIAGGSIMNGTSYLCQRSNFFEIRELMIWAVVAFNSRDEWTDPEWIVKTSREAMQHDFASWTPTVRAIISNMKNPDVWALFNHAPARTFYQARPRICLLGDAAHASTPHQGAGAGMCVEDCYVLGGLLAEVASAERLERAFKVYDQVRRRRALKLVETSREAGRLWDLEGGEGLDMEAFERNACERMGWIWDHDIEADLVRARELLRA